MFQFCYLWLYLGTETVSCRLSLRIAYKLDFIKFDALSKKIISAKNYYGYALITWNPTPTPTRRNVGDF